MFVIRTKGSKQIQLMIKNFREQINDALKLRREKDSPRVLWLILTVFFFTVTYCILAVYAVPSDKPPDFNFQEGGAITALSAIYLTLACGFAIGSNLLHKRAVGKYQLLWTILAFGFAFLAFDELLQFHERADRLFFERIFSESAFSGWNDLIVIMYGVIAIPVMIYLLPALLRYRFVLELFVISFLFYALHTTIDSVQETSTLTTIIFEESAKLLSVSLLMLGSFTGFFANVRQYVVPS